MGTKKKGNVRTAIPRALPLVIVFVFGVVFCAASSKNTDEAAATQFLEDLDPGYITEANKQMKARWDYITNVNEANSNAQVDANVAFLDFQKQKWAEVNEFDWTNFQNPTVKREFNYLNILGPAILSEEDARKYTTLQDEMETTYSTAKVCSYEDPNCSQPNLPLDPDLTEIMATSTNYEELQHVWLQWRNAAGAPIREKYLEFVALNNKAAVENKFNDMGSLWNEYYLFEGYSESDFKTDIDALWHQVKPLYEQLYTYVRRILATEVYPGKVQRYGRLPAHVLGNMWAQSWGNVAKHVLPYPDAPAVDATPGMIAKNYTARMMFDKADEFFQGLGLDKMTDTFWDESLIEKPNDREVVCHASAEEFFFGPGDDTNVREDWRIKMCTTITQEDFVTVHHEMGHIQYFMNYRNQHWVFRNGANPGFHEAIGDTIALAVSTPAHLTGLGLLPENANKKTKPRFKDLPALPEGVTEQDLNYLLSQALEKIAFIPFGYLMDKWRWSVFSGETTIETLNADWWKLREELQGLKPPVERSENDFDPGAKYHIPANVEYIRYFVSYIIQFQFYESMCKAAGQYDPTKPDMPLYKCDFAGSAEAGAKLKALLEPGFSQPWPDALEAMTESRKMDATSLLTYFAPLKTWLEQANANARDCIGWDDYCESYASEYVYGTYEQETSSLLNAAVIGDWDYNTNLTEHNAMVATEKSVILANHLKTQWETFFYDQFEYQYFKNESLKRIFELQQNLGTAALDEADYENRTNTINKMMDQYSSSKICPYKKPNCNDNEKLYLEPDLVGILATSQDYDELSYVWKEWRQVASKPMQDDYEKYIELSNKAAQANGKNDMSELWKAPYEMEDFQAELEKILNQTRPLYEKLHAFTRMKLRERYGNTIGKDTPIPASVLGNMWAQTWESLYDLLAPYPDEGAVDVTDEMIAQNWTVTRMFKESESFYTSIGLEPMPTSYGEKSMITKPDDRDVVCHASAWDFSDKEDFRIKMCTEINMVDLVTIHHEQGHIQYYIQYKDQPITFRDGANPGFHEAIGDVMALSVSTPGHMEKIGLIENYVPNEKSDLNFLMRTALEKVTFPPFAYVMDRWRWGVFSGEYKRIDWMHAWMQLSEKYQGIVPPVLRHHDDFDPGAKYHIAADVEYSRYFVANILQFQLHKALCEAAGEFDPNDPSKPLYRCDIYESKEAGTIMKTLLQAGLSKPWRETLNEAIGTDELDASAVLFYFKPLEDYLDEQLKAAGEKVGWVSTFEDWYEEPPGDNTVPIIVGSVLGAVIVVVIVAYFVGRRATKSKSGQITQGVDNPVVVVE